MNFEEWWKDCMGFIEYEPDQYNKGMARAAWEAAYKQGFDEGELVGFEKGVDYADKRDRDYDKIGV